ncbi:MAG: hypothetical protein ACFFD3_08070 [Candidatus Thorarchaeota archaeon]
MEIPIITNFIEGLKLFFASRRLKWVTLVFFIGAAFIYLLERLLAYTGPIAGPIVTLLGAIFPIFYMLATFVSLIGLQRYIADEESYKKSAIYTIIWLVVSVIFLIVSFAFLGFLLVVVFAGFFIWIGFQAYFSTRTALGIATGVNVGYRSKLTTLLFGAANIFNYAILFGAAIVTALFFAPGGISGVAWFGAIVGILIAGFFNFINGLVITAERNKQTADNLSLLGLFIALYSGYFIYNVLKGADLGPDPIGLAVTVFFLLYTMSGVGRSLSSRADLDTRWKLSKELAATFTYFLASCYVFVDVMFTVLLLQAGVPADQMAPFSDILKLWLFPLVALVVELIYVRRSRKATAIPEAPEEMPVVLVEEVVYDEHGEVERHTPIIETKSMDEDAEEPEPDEEEYEESEEEEDSDYSDYDESPADEDEE